MRARFLAYDEQMLFADGLDEAILGVAERCGQPPLVAYDRSRCIDILAAQGMDREEAEEYFEFNVVGAWVGPYTPIFIDGRVCE